MKAIFNQNDPFYAVSAFSVLLMEMGNEDLTRG